MSSYIKMATFAVVLHIVFYAAMNFIMVPDTMAGADGTEYVSLAGNLGVFEFEPNLIDVFLGPTYTSVVNSAWDNWTEYPEINQSTIAIPSQVGGEVIGTGVVSFLDPLKIIYAVLNTFLNISFGPLFVLFSNKIHPLFGILLGIPYVIIMFLTVIAIIRGIGD